MSHTTAPRGYSQPNEFSSHHNNTRFGKLNTVLYWKSKATADNLDGRTLRGNTQQSATTTRKATPTQQKATRRREPTPAINRGNHHHKHRSDGQWSKKRHERGVVLLRFVIYRKKEQRNLESLQQARRCVFSIFVYSVMEALKRVIRVSVAPAYLMRRASARDSESRRWIRPGRIKRAPAKGDRLNDAYL